MFTENRAQNNIEYHQMLLSYVLGNEAKRNADIINEQAYSGTLSRREILRVNARLGERRRDKEKLSSPISFELKRVKAS